VCAEILIKFGHAKRNSVTRPSRLLHFKHQETSKQVITSGRVHLMTDCFSSGLYINCVQPRVGRVARPARPNPRIAWDCKVGDFCPFLLPRAVHHFAHLAVSSDPPVRPGGGGAPPPAPPNSSSPLITHIKLILTAVTERMKRKLVRGPLMYKKRRSLTAPRARCTAAPQRPRAQANRPLHAERSRKQGTLYRIRGAIAETVPF
jgi:hypothetical protein